MTIVRFGCLRLLMFAGIAGVATAAPKDGARDFVDRVIANDRRPDIDLRSRAFLSLLTPRLRRAIEVDMSGSDVGILDYDPICQCQDNEGLIFRVVSIREGPTKAAAAIESRSGRDTRRVKLQLVRTSQGWRIGDFATKAEPSLLHDLERSNRAR